MAPRSLYGLGVVANAPLPGLGDYPPATTVDVEILVGALPPFSGSRAEALSRPWVSRLVTNDGHVELLATRLPQTGAFRLDYDDGTVVVVDRTGSRIWATCPPQVPLAQLAVYLLGPVMGVALRARGIFCMHASAVSMAEGALALVGASQAGKSSTAAALSQQGYAVIGDDILPVRERAGRFEVAASLPRLRLWPDAASAVYGSAEGLPRLWPRDDKRLVPVSGPAPGRHEPLRVAYFLHRAPDVDAVLIEEMPPAGAAVAIVADSFAARYVDREGRAREFDLVSRLVCAVPMRRVQIPYDLRRLAEVARAIAADAGEVAGRTPLHV